MNKSARGIIFDCDGTLVDSLGAALESFNFAIVKMGEPPKTPQEIKKYFGASADRILIQLLNDQQRGLEAFEIFKDHQTELASQTKLHPGISDLLDTLLAHEVPIAIVTGRHEQDLEIVLKPHKISQRFITLVADNHVPESKPAPDGIRLAASRMGLEPHNIMYVGDSPMDLQAAHASGAAAVAAMWDSLVKREAMLQEKPTFVAETPANVWQIYNEWAKLII